MTNEQAKEPGWSNLELQHNFLSAVCHADLELVKQLLQAGASINERIWFRRSKTLVSALHVACRMDFVGIAEFLVNSGAVIENYSDGEFIYTPLSCAGPKTLRFLVEKGANVNAVGTGAYRSVLGGHLYEESYDEFVFLLDHGADIEAPGCFGQSLLERIVEHRGGTSQLKEILKRGISLNDSDH